MRFIEILKNSARFTIIFLKLTYDYSSKEENYISFDLIGLQTTEISMLKAVKTQQPCYFTYVLTAVSIKISKKRYYFLHYCCSHIELIIVMVQYLRILIKCSTNAVLAAILKKMKCNRRVCIKGSV